MEIKPILGVLLILGFGVVLGANETCAPDETSNVNQCLLNFVMAHSQHQLELIAAKTCKVQLLNCSALDAAYKCLNSYRLSSLCIDSLEDTINKYIYDLQITCKVADFNRHCPDVTKITKEDSAATTPSGPVSSCSLAAPWMLLTFIFLIPVLLK